MAKKKKAQVEQPKALTKKQITRSKKVERQQRMIWFSVAAVTVLVLTVLTVGLVQEYVLAPRQPEAVVNGQEISQAEYQKRVRYELWDLRLIEQNLAAQQALYDPNDEVQQLYYQYLESQLSYVRDQQLSVPTQALENLIDEALVRQEATNRGLTVSADEIERSLELRFGYDRLLPLPTPTPITATAALTPTESLEPITYEEFKANYAEYMDALTSAVNGFSEEDYRYLVEQSLLREKLGEALAAQVPTTDEHVHVYQILLDSQETADEVLTKLKDGAEFADLVAEYSTDEETTAQGGELGWLARDQIDVPQEVVEAAFALQLGEFSEVISTYLGYHIITVDAHQADRPLDEATLEARQSQALSEWLTQAKEVTTIERHWSADDIPEL